MVNDSNQYTLKPFFLRSRLWYHINLYGTWFFR